VKTFRSLFPTGRTALAYVIACACVIALAALAWPSHTTPEPNLCTRVQLAVHTLYQRAKFTPAWVPATPPGALIYLERATCDTPDATCNHVELYVNNLYEGALVGEVDLSPPAVRELQDLECALCNQPTGLCSQLPREEVTPAP